MTPSFIQQALDRDRQCFFSGAVPSCDSDALVATWVFPPFLGYEVSIHNISMLIFSATPIIFMKLCRDSDPWLENKYYDDPEACDISEFMAVENVVSGRKDIVTLFWDNKLGVDVEVRILPFRKFAMVFMTYRIIIASSYSRDQKT